MHERQERVDQVELLLTRLLLLLFGDDTGMWFFQHLNRREDKRPANLKDLIARFPYVNGGLFHDPIESPSFDRLMRNEPVACAQFD